MLAGWTHMAKQIHTGIGVEWRAGKDRQSRIVNRLLVVVHSVHSMSDEAAILAAHGDVPVAIANRLLVGLRA